MFCGGRGQLWDSNRWAVTAEEILSRWNRKNRCTESRSEGRNRGISHEIETGSGPGRVVIDAWAHFNLTW
jgi:hypothetical protein